MSTPVIQPPQMPAIPSPAPPNYENVIGMVFYTVLGMDNSLGLTLSVFNFYQKRKLWLSVMNLMLSSNLI